MMKTIAFFDFDGTITRDDTFISFGKFSLGKSRFIAKVVLASPWLILWKLGIISNSKAKETLFRFLFKGMEKTRFHRYCNDFKSVIENNLNPTIKRELEKHQANNDQIVIVSASITDWIKPWAGSHNINDILATEIEVDKDNKLTGRFSSLNCHGKEKVNRIKKAFGDISGIETYAYGDSKGDDAMLSLVKHRIKV